MLMVRHGETRSNQQRIFHSILNDPLDDAGVKQAGEAAEFCAHFPVALVVASPLDRASATGQAIAQRLGVPLEHDSNLLPWNVGKLTGKVQTEDLKAIRDHYIQHPEETIPGGESLEAREERFRDILKRVGSFAQSGRLAVLVTHASGLMAVNNILSGKDDDSSIVQPGGVAGIFQNGQSHELRPMFRSDSEAIQGTAQAGYVHNGKQYCGVCIHRKPGTPLCIHPEVLADPEMSHLKEGDAVRIDLENGCCDYINKGESGEPTNS